ncbi:MAG: hypothetical protein R6U96_13130 [Promethearchaeia archaeon]
MEKRNVRGGGARGMSTLEKRNCLLCIHLDTCYLLNNLRQESNLIGKFLYRINLIASLCNKYKEKEAEREG